MYCHSWSSSSIGTAAILAAPARLKATICKLQELAAGELTAFFIYEEAHSSSLGMSFDVLVFGMLSRITGHLRLAWFPFLKNLWLGSKCREWKRQASGCMDLDQLLHLQPIHLHVGLSEQREAWVIIISIRVQELREKMRVQGGGLPPLPVAKSTPRQQTMRLASSHCLEAACGTQGTAHCR
jgi:hypothetical protein